MQIKIIIYAIINTLKTNTMHYIKSNAPLDIKIIKFELARTEDGMILQDSFPEKLLSNFKTIHTRYNDQADWEEIIYTGDYQDLDYALKEIIGHLFYQTALGVGTYDHFAFEVPDLYFQFIQLIKTLQENKVDLDMDKLNTMWNSLTELYKTLNKEDQFGPQEFDSLETNLQTITETLNQLNKRVLL